MIKELKYDITKEDYAKALGRCNIDNKLTVKQFFLYMIIIAVVIIFGIQAKKIVEPAVITAFFLVLMLGKLFIKNTGILGNFTIIIDSDKNNFSSKTAERDYSINWNTVFKIDNIDSSILIYTDRTVAIIIPKRIFESEQEMNETWELIQECYNKNREEKG